MHFIWRQVEAELGFAVARYELLLQTVAPNLVNVRKEIQNRVETRPQITVFVNYIPRCH